MAAPGYIEALHAAYAEHAPLTDGQLLLGLPPLALHALLEHLQPADKEVLLMTSSAARAAVLHHAKFLAFCLRGSNATGRGAAAQAAGEGAELCSVLARRKGVLDFALDVTGVSEHSSAQQLKALEQLLVRIAEAPRPQVASGGTQCCVRSLSVMGFVDPPPHEPLSVGPGAPAAATPTTWGPALAAAFPQLEVLVLHDCYVDAALISGLSALQRLTGLHLTDNRLSPDLSQLVTQGMSLPPKLQDLHTEAGADHPLVQALADQLTALYIHKLNDAGLRAAMALPQLVHLHAQELDLQSPVPPGHEWAARGVHVLLGLNRSFDPNREMREVCTRSLERFPKTDRVLVLEAPHLRVPLDLRAAPATITQQVHTVMSAQMQASRFFPPSILTFVGFESAAPDAARVAVCAATRGCAPMKPRGSRSLTLSALQLPHGTSLGAGLLQAVHDACGAWLPTLELRMEDTERNCCLADMWQALDAEGPDGPQLLPKLSRLIINGHWNLVGSPSLVGAAAFGAFCRTTTRELNIRFVALNDFGFRETQELVQAVLPWASRSLALEVCSPPADEEEDEDWDEA